MTECRHATSSAWGRGTDDIKSAHSDPHIDRSPALKSRTWVSCSSKYTINSHQSTENITIGMLILFSSPKLMALR